MNILRHPLILKNSSSSLHCNVPLPGNRLFVLATAFGDILSFRKTSEGAAMTAYFRLRTCPLI